MFRSLSNIIGPSVQYCNVKLEMHDKYVGCVRSHNFTKKILHNLTSQYCIDSPMMIESDRNMWLYQNEYY